jgi:hypothetical protein
MPSRLSPSIPENSSHRYSAQDNSLSVSSSFRRESEGILLALEVKENEFKELEKQHRIALQEIKLLQLDVKASRNGREILSIEQQHKVNSNFDLHHLSNFDLHHALLCVNFYSFFADLGSDGNS